MEVINPHRFAAAPAVDFDGFGNASRYFDGVSDYISIPDINESNTAFSAMCWVKTTAVDWTNTFFAHWDGTSGQRSWVILPSRTAETNGKKLMVYITDDGSGGSTRSKRYYGTTDVSDGTWHHCAFTWDNGTLKLYVDGIEETTTKVWDVAFTSILNSSGPLSIGAVNPTVGGTSFVDAHIADCRIYDAVLSSTDIAAIYGGENITTNLVGHWLKDTPSLLDHSGTNDGTNVGSAFAYDNPSPAVEFGKASRSFDGVNAYISMGDVLDSVFAGTGKQFTIAAWIKTTTLENTDFFSKYLTSGNQRSFTCRVLSDGNLAMVMSGDGALGNRWGRQTDTAPISANTWHHVAITYDQTATGDYLRMWVNGVEDATLVDWLSSGTFTSIYDGTAATRISGIDGGFNENWGGNIADVRVYDTNLSSTDIAAIYNGTHVETNLVGHWLTNTDDVKDYAGVNDGTNNGSTYSFDNPLSEGEFGSASRDFNLGTDYVDLGNSTDFDLTSTLTMAFWINPDIAHNGGIFSKWTSGAGTNNSYTCYLGQDTGNQRVAFLIQESDNSPIINLKSNIDLPLNAWSHICCVADGTNMRIYINGVLNVSTTYDGTIKTTTKKIVLGKLREEDNLYPFDGNIADVRLYDTGLLAQDIFDISRGYDLRTNLIGHWLTNKDDVDDYAGTNHGTNNGSTYSLDAPL